MKIRTIISILALFTLIVSCEDPMEGIDENNGNSSINSGIGGSGDNNNESNPNNDTLDLENIICLQGITNTIQWFLYATYSPDSEHILAVSADTMFHILNANTLAVEQEFVTPNNIILQGEFSPDGNWVVAGGTDNTASIWDLRKGYSLILRGHTERVVWVDWSPTENKVVTASMDGSLKIWDSGSGNCINTFSSSEFGYGMCVSYSPDGSRLAAIASDTTVKILDANTGNILLSLVGHNYGHYSAYFSSDGNRVVTGGFDGKMKVWDANTGQELYSTVDFQGHRVVSASYSQDGKYIIAGGQDHGVRIYDAQTFECLKTVAVDNNLTSVNWSPNGRRFVTTSGQKTLKVWGN